MSRLERDLHEAGALHRLGFTANLVARRRFADDRSTDSGHALTVIGTLCTLGSCAPKLSLARQKWWLSC
jgi:hypothetical protein